jgi:signal transduction histidine kinase
MIDARGEIPALRSAAPSVEESVKRRWRAYIVAVGVTALVLVLRLSLAAWTGDRPGLVLFVIPIIVSAYLGGLGPGLLSTVLVGLSTNFFILEPTHSLTIAQPVDLGNWLTLLLEGALISVLTEELHRARRQYRDVALEPQSWATERKVQGSFVFALACVGVIGAASLLAVGQLREDIKWVGHTQEVLNSLELIYSRTTDAQNGRRAYTITGDQSYLEPYTATALTIHSDLDKSRTLTQDNVVQQKRVDTLAELIDKQLAFSGEVITARRTQGFEVARRLSLTGEGRFLFDQIRHMIDDMKGAESALLEERQQRAGRSAAFAQSVIFGGGIVAFVFVGLALVVIRRDFARHRQAEARIADLNETLLARATQLEAANKELESFSYSISHDLRAPLRHVQGYAQMLTREVEGTLADEPLRYLKTISAASREMGQLIDELLSFSRMGRAEMRESHVELNKLIDAAREKLEFATKDRNIHWNIAELPTVQGDPAMLQQVIANLLDNAVKYTRGRDSAEIEVGRAGEEDGRLVFFVRDNGAGFDMRYAEKLFGIFQRMHRVDEFEGTGIGLASVQRIIIRHGGRAWAEARPNLGATIYFTLNPANLKPLAE